MSRDYDAIVIGSGIGGLTSGALLARAGKRVLVLEQHDKIGGYAHSFMRRGFRFESGIHSIPLGPSGLIRHILRLLDVDQLVDSVPLRSMFSVNMPGCEFAMPVWLDDIIQAVSDVFPGESVGVRRMLDDMRNFYDAMAGPLFHLEERPFDPFTQNKDFMSRYYGRSYREYVEGFITDERLRHIFCSHWPFVGSSADAGPVIFNVLLYYVHAVEGSHYVKGGMRNLAAALQQSITGKGGEVRTRSRVAGIRMDGQCAAAVVLDSKEDVSADLFVSNVSPYLLHRELIPVDARNRMWLRRLESLRPSISSVGVYLGLRPNADVPPLEGINLHYAHDDFAKMCAGTLSNAHRGSDHLVLLGTPGEEEKRTMLLMRFASQHGVTDWKSEKKQWAQEMLTQANTVLPGLSDAVEVMEVGSPSTFERYTGNTHGALYGFECTKSLYGEAKMPSQTHIPNLHQVGHWGKPGGGVWNVMYNSYLATSQILRSGSLTQA